MTGQRRSAVIFLITLLIVFSVAFPHTGLDLIAKRTRRDIQCGDDAHKDNNICCKLCPAGKRLVSSCTKNLGTGTCEECDSGTYLNHPNYERKCLPCTNCREDEDVVRQCTHTEDTVCQCKAGKFCSDDHPCEFCRTCTKCGPGEEVARNCTATSDTECKKVSPPPDSNTAVAAVAVPIVLVTLLGCGLALYCYKKKKGTCDSPSIRQKAGQETDGLSRVRMVPDKSEEHHALFDGANSSANSSASSSQHSIIAPPYHEYAAPYHAYAAPPLLGRAFTPVPPVNVSLEELPQLTPTNGQESLRKCFEYFENLELREYTKFFRRLNIHENVIQSKETLYYSDRMHAMLGVWLETQGKNASLNQLLEVLRDLNQRRTAETIIEHAVEKGHYVKL